MTINSDCGVTFSLKVLVIQRELEVQWKFLHSSHCETTSVVFSFILNYFFINKHYTKFESEHKGTYEMLPRIMKTRVRLSYKIFTTHGQWQ